MFACVISSAALPIAPSRRAVDRSTSADTSEFENTIAQLKQSDSGVTVKGSLTQSENGISGECSFVLVQGGQEAPNPLAVIKAAGGADDIQVFGEMEVSVAPDGGELQTAMIVNFTVGKEVPNFDLVVHVPVAQASFSFSFNAETSTVSIMASAEGNNVMISFQVGMSEGELVVCPVDEANAIDLQNLTEEQTQQLQNEAMQAVSPLLSALASVLG